MEPGTPIGQRAFAPGWRSERMMKSILLTTALASVAVVNVAVSDVEIGAGENEPVGQRVVDAESQPGREPPAVYAQWPFDEREALRRQEETAEAIGQPVEFINSVGMTLRLIPAGEFMMGSPEDEETRQSDEGPLHLVRITKPCYLGAYEVTMDQFRRFVDASEYQTDAETDGRGGWGYTGDDNRLFARDPGYTWRETGFPQSDEHPVVNVSWNDAVAFCEWLSRKEAAMYRLPTEAEWEYACRAGTETGYYHGDDADGLAEVGNVADATANRSFAGWMRINETDRRKIGNATHSDGYVFTAPVGRFRANAFGLYDMHGNVWEWCADWDKADYYQESPTVDPTGPPDGESRIRRGGAWFHAPGYARSARRRRYAPNARNSPIGFRVVCVPQTADSEGPGAS